MLKYIFSFLIIFHVVSFSQVVTTIPVVPTENDSIVIFFHADRGDAGLLNYTGDVYTHTGVNTNKGVWQHVIGTWGNDATQPKLTRLNTNLYLLTIAYPRKFYNIKDSSEHITSLNFVFRSAGATGPTGRDVGGADIFVPVFKEGLNVSITQPSDKFSFAQIGDNINLKATANASDSLFLYRDSELLTKTDSSSISFNVNVNSSGKHWLIAKATNGSAAVSDSVYYVVRGDVQIAPLPSGTKTGINYIDNSTVTLELYAPHKKFVYVIGDFNNWSVDPNYYMKLSPDSTTWWTTISGLTAKQEYAFQYLVDGNLRIADPYTDKILDPWNDKFIDSNTYPNLKPYPKGKTTDAVSVLQTAQTPYVWQNTNFTRPAKTDLIVYELLIRDFVKSHNYQTLIDTLDYLKNLGVNAIELMPINEFEGNSSWGYNPSFYFAPDKYYGTKNALKRFIDAAHGKGIAVIMDMVLNHSFGQSPFVRLYASGNYGPPTAENPWYNPDMNPNKSGYQGPHPFGVGYDFNHESPQTQKLVDRINNYWLSQYKVDGFRYDLSKGFTQKYSGDNVGLWGQYDQSRINILERMANAIWPWNPTAYLILEHFADNREETVLSNFGFMLWGNLNYNYNEATMGYNQPGHSDFSGISYKKRGWNDPHVLGYMESHDEERLMYKNLQYGNSSGDYDITNLNIALNRIKLASAFFFTIPGPKMIWQFGELGYDYSINYPSGSDQDRLTPKPIRWDYFSDTARKNLYKTMKAIISLRESYDVFRTANFSLDVSGAGKRIWLNGSDMNVAIVGNFGVSSLSITPSFQNTGTWYDYFSGDSVNVSDTQMQINLKPGEFHIYTSINTPHPGSDILTDVKDGKMPLIEDYKLFQNYPNPFNPSTIISYQLPKYSFVKVSIFNVLGKEVKTLVSRNQGKGRYQITWDGTDESGNKVATGIYLYRIKSDNFIATKKMILLK